ncbi:ABC-2 family transporter protein [Corynebacterium kalinowskii]|uniref:ABC-2 family transporter protein n=1 Tax=Corynebacterium kalinowskii TaxID=2675216 RepID=A0A6B8VR47_9CORY|nr:ABC transporter permease [Corynebacterium kalinowskii]QGU02067.1 ABC-2 family transporter protein [Corynebacterium kalinowskii]
MFQPGTFSPAPQRASIGAMVRAQALIEAKLFLRHGEQQLLSMIIPLALLVGLTLVPVLDDADPVQRVFPFTLAIAGMSAGFTGQAIAVAFDRRYGALKRIGASGVPAWTIIVGKVVAVLAVALLQAIVLGAVATVLGFHTSMLGVLLSFCAVVMGVATFTALGLLLGGTLGSEAVLASANLIWFVLIGAAAYATFRAGADASPWLQWLPSVAVVESLTSAFQGSVAWLSFLVLGCWFAAASIAAVRLFKFTG